uniref:Mediator of RNA polymerase II transcription subunit 20 n=1 Tax=Solanum lycopersicum TaxID=4081 RepID=A0A3Q7J6W2_SOLLC
METLFYFLRIRLNFFICVHIQDLINFPLILGASLHEQPNKLYMTLNRKRLVVEAQSLMQKIMENLLSYRMKVAIHCKEYSNTIPINSENLREIVMEMEYLPISSWETSHMIMSDFFKIWKETLGKKIITGLFYAC